MFVLVQGQEATHHLQQQASQLDDHEQQLQDVKRTQETMTGMVHIPYLPTR